MGTETGLVFNIQKFCVHDGPGIRSVVFFKGCPLSCQWCANPEGIHAYPEVAFKANQCIGLDKCGRCLAACPQGAITDGGNIPLIDRALCNHCCRCADVCPALAITAFGRRMTTAEIMEEVTKDDAFYARSAGGVTFSGGEPLLQAEFLVSLIQEAQAWGLTTAIETTGYAPWEKAEAVFRELDFIHYDLKHRDDEKHRQYTGVSNGLCLDNFKRLCRQYPDKKILVRTPVIPGFNDTVEEIQAIADFIGEAAQGVSDIAYELLPFHQFGSAKYAFLGRPYALEALKNMDKNFVEGLKENIRRTVRMV